MEKDAHLVKGPNSTLDSGKADLSSMNSSLGTVPSSPIPKAPTRYRERIPSPWMNQPKKEKETRTTLQRVNSKSLPQITKTLCEYRGCEACEVCKQGTITSRIYFPTTALNPRSTGSQQDVKPKTEEDDYDEILSRDNTRVVRRPIPAVASATVPRSSRADAPTKVVDQKRSAAPSPPPRGIPARKHPPKRECLGYSQVSVVSAEMPSEPSECSSSDSDALSYQLDPPVVFRRSMDSGVGDEEVTRL
ncbi:hypothetical protein OSTOST_09795 [Ostertagia ostertagi]